MSMGKLNVNKISDNVFSFSANVSSSGEEEVIWDYLFVLSEDKETLAIAGCWGS